jgi:hypothetical protein
MVVKSPHRRRVLPGMFAGLLALLVLQACAPDRSIPQLNLSTDDSASLCADGSSGGPFSSGDPCVGRGGLVAWWPRPMVVPIGGVGICHDGTVIFSADLERACSTHLGVGAKAAPRVVICKDGSQLDVLDVRDACRNAGGIWAIGGPLVAVCQDSSLVYDDLSTGTRNRCAGHGGRFYNLATDYELCSDLTVSYPWLESTACFHHGGKLAGTVWPDVLCRDGHPGYYGPIVGPQGVFGPPVRRDTCREHGGIGAYLSR